MCLTVLVSKIRLLVRGNVLGLERLALWPVAAWEMSSAVFCILDGDLFANLLSRCGSRCGDNEMKTLFYENCESTYGLLQLLLTDLETL